MIEVQNIDQEVEEAEGSHSSKSAKPPHRDRSRALLEKKTLIPALKQSFVMLRPDLQWKNPVMFVVEIGAILTLLYVIAEAFGSAISRFRSPISLLWTHGYF